MEWRTLAEQGKEPEHVHKHGKVTKFEVVGSPPQKIVAFTTQICSECGEKFTEVV